MAFNPHDLIRPEILRLKAYQVADARGMVKLDAMENPYSLPEDLRKVAAGLVSDAALNRYPDSQAAELRHAIRKRMGVPEGAQILFGNGSDELIQLIALALAKPGATILAPEPSFVMYRMIATFCGMHYVGVPLTEHFSLDPDEMVLRIEQHQPAVVFIAYPNNPTGTLFDADAMARVLHAAPGLVVVDEAYHAFAGSSFMEELRRHPNLLVMRTLSKLGLAALRLGFVAGAPQWLAEIDKLRLPYNINSLTQAIATHLVENVGRLNAQAAAIVTSRTQLAHALADMPDLRIWQSHANFILFRVPNAPRTFDLLKRQRVLIKNLHGTHPMLDNCLRMTVGTPGENAIFLNALRASLA
ncbi:MAG: histidinol-phosphate transaminase [Candidatus Methylophosphatis roskildensis]